jgi:hypothetical protein
MVINKHITKYLNKSIYYNYSNGPEVISTYKDAVRFGINCIGLMHLLIHDVFEVTLPKYLRVLEIYHDNPFFHSVNGIETAILGDIIFLGRKILPIYINSYIPKYDHCAHLMNENEGKTIIGNQYAGFHTAMYCGKDEDNQPLFIDIQKCTNEIKIWHLHELYSFEQYEVLYAIKRLIK